MHDLDDSHVHLVIGRQTTSLARAPSRFEVMRSRSPHWCLCPSCDVVMRARHGTRQNDDIAALRDKVAVATLVYLYPYSKVNVNAVCVQLSASRARQARHPTPSTPRTKYANPCTAARPCPRPRPSRRLPQSSRRHDTRATTWFISYQHQTRHFSKRGETLMGMSIHTWRR